MVAKRRKAQTTTNILAVNGLNVTVIRKQIKHIHLVVYPPDGRVRISAPLHTGDDAIRQMVAAKFAWIRRQQERIAALPASLAPLYLSGEVHTYQGERYVLDVVYQDAPPCVIAHHTTAGDGLRLELRVRPGSDAAARERALLAWYRQQLQDALPPLLAKWQPILGVQAREVRIRRMKSRWGSCVPARRRIWINLELIRKPPRLLEYVVVHELAHLLEPAGRDGPHNARFKAVLDRHLPGWRELRRELNPTY